MTANIESMTGKSREIADIMHKRKIMIACVQEINVNAAKPTRPRKVSKPTTMEYAEPEMEYESSLVNNGSTIS